MTRAVRTLALVLLAVLAVASCKKSSTEAAALAATDASVTLPVVKDSTEGLLFAWIDEKGEFHMVEKVADVPVVGRDTVRVMDPVNYDTSHPDQVFVADLRVAGADGTYPVRVATRAELDAIALARRGKSGPTLASAAHPAPAASSAAAGAGEPPGGGAQVNAQPPGPGGTRPAVIIYGASWCGACHQAAAYLKRKGVAFVELDIEDDANAAREMQSKLSHAGKRGGSIPVIDVHGKIMVGFNPQEVDQALGQAL